jgi:hypothetical protein
MNSSYKGTIVEESLVDNRILNGLEIIDFKISDDENPADRWHLYTVSVTRDDIERVSRSIKSGKWYMHFWNGNEVIAVFKDKSFEFMYDRKETWKSAVEHGRSLGIPEEQLNFVVG